MAILAERYGNRIHIKPTGYLGGDKFQEYLHLVRQVPGSTYSKSKKCQTAPLDLAVCRIMREVFGKYLQVGPELSAWARAAIAHEKTVLHVHTLDLTKPVELEHVPTLAPTMYAAMCQRGFQPVAAKFGALVGDYINADEPGLGKSIETFGALVEGGRRGRALIFAPSSSLRATWEYEIGKWLNDLPGGVGVWVADGDAKNRQVVLEDYEEFGGQQGHYLDFLLINPEMLRLSESHWCPLDTDEKWQQGFGKNDHCDGTDPHCDAADKHKVTRSGKYPQLFDMVWNAAIGDEMHKYMTNANPRARQRMSQVGLGIHRIPRAENGVRVALTGTPMKGKPRLVWPVLHWLRPDYYTSEGRFKEMYLEYVNNPYSYNGKQYVDTIRPDREEQFHLELSRIMIRRTKPELRAINPTWAPPEKLYNYVPITLGKVQRKQYDSIISGGMFQGMTIDGVLAERTRQKQLAGCSGTVIRDGYDYKFMPVLPSAKFEWLVDSLLQSLGITGKEATEVGDAKVVVASQFTSFVNLWAGALRKAGIACHVLTGETSSQERLRQQQEFQAPGGPRVFLLNTHAGGVSLTLDAADDLVVMDRTENPDDQTQVEDRVHRTSRTDHQVNIWYPSAVNTIDDEIHEMNEFKDKNQRKHLDGRRGVVFAKQLAAGGAEI